MGIFRTKYCHVSVNEKLICISAYSGYRLLRMDPEASCYYLNIDESAQKIGETILISLKESRNLTYEESVALFVSSDHHYKKWIDEMGERGGYKTKRALFKRMANCSVELEDNTLIFRPYHHDKLEGWEPTFRGEADYIRLPINSSPEKIGEAFWEALRRCTGPRPDFLDSPSV